MLITGTFDGIEYANFIIFHVLAEHNKICSSELREHRANLGCKSSLTNERGPNYRDRNHLLVVELLEIH